MELGYIIMVTINNHDFFGPVHQGIYYSYRGYPHSHPIK